MHEECNDCPHSKDLPSYIAICISRKQLVLFGAGLANGAWQDTLRALDADLFHSGSVIEGHVLFVILLRSVIQLIHQ